MENGVNDPRGSHTDTHVSRVGNHLRKGFRLPCTFREWENILTTFFPTGSCRQIWGCVHTVRPLALCPPVSGARHLHGQQPRGDAGFRPVRSPRAQCQLWEGTKAPFSSGFSWLV